MKARGVRRKRGLRRRSQPDARERALAAPGAIWKRAKRAFVGFFERT